MQLQPTTKSNECRCNDDVESVQTVNRHVDSRHETQRLLFACQVQCYNLKHCNMQDTEQCCMATSLQALTDGHVDSRHETVRVATKHRVSDEVGRLTDMRQQTKSFVDHTFLAQPPLALTVRRVMKRELLKPQHKSLARATCLDVRLTDVSEVRED